jgi:hypothetical protein
MQNSEFETDRRLQIFKSSKFWDSNVWGATVAGIGMGFLMTAIAGILLWRSGDRNLQMFALLWILTVVTTLLALFPGNLITTVPVAVKLEEGKGLHLIAPLKRLYIPMEEVKEVRDSTFWQIFQQGTVVKLNKRHGLMKSFAIHWAFGDQGKELARAIRLEISHRGGWTD